MGSSTPEGVAAKIPDRRALVTGSGTGIGRCLALGLVERGARVLVCGRRAEPLEEVAKASPRITTLPCDVSREDERERLHRRVESGLGGLDLLLNNAAIDAPRDLAGAGPVATRSSRRSPRTCSHRSG